MQKKFRIYAVSAVFAAVVCGGLSWAVLPYSTFEIGLAQVACDLGEFVGAESLFGQGQMLEEECANLEVAIIASGALLGLAIASAIGAGVIGIAGYARSSKNEPAS